MSHPGNDGRNGPKEHGKPKLRAEVSQVAPAATSRGDSLTLLGAGAAFSCTRTIITLLVAIVLTAPLIGCSKPLGKTVREAAIELRLIDAPPLPLALVDVLCDPSSGSTCTEAALSATLDDALAYAATAREGSQVRLWLQGERGEQLSLVRVGEVRRFVGRYESERRKDIRAWIASERRRFLEAARPHAAARPRRSPVAESITLVALASGLPAGRRDLVVVGDLREMSELAEMECGDASAETFRRSLDAARVLSRGSLRGIRVHLAFVQGGPVDGGRCESTVARELAIRETWRVTLLDAGAANVDIRYGAPELATPKKEARNDVAAAQ